MQIIFRSRGIATGTESDKRCLNVQASDVDEARKLLDEQMKRESEEIIVVLAIAPAAWMNSLSSVPPTEHDIAVANKSYESWAKKVGLSVDDLASAEAATLDNKYDDQEVLGLEADGTVIQWNGETNQRYNSGETLEEFGVHNLNEVERARCGLDPR